MRATYTQTHICSELARSSWLFHGGRGGGRRKGGGRADYHSSLYFQLITRARFVYIRIYYYKETISKEASEPPGKPTSKLRPCRHLYYYAWRLSSLHSPDRSGQTALVLIAMTPRGGARRILGPGGLVSRGGGGCQGRYASRGQEGVSQKGLILT